VACFNKRAQNFVDNGVIFLKSRFNRTSGLTNELRGHWAKPTEIKTELKLPEAIS